MVHPRGPVIAYIAFSRGRFCIAERHAHPEPHGIVEAECREWLGDGHHVGRVSTERRTLLLIWQGGRQRGQSLVDVPSASRILHYVLVMVHLLESTNR